MAVQPTEQQVSEDCCADESNRSEPEPVDGRDDLILTRCKCGRRHFELTVDAGKLGLKFI